MQKLPTADKNGKKIGVILKIVINLIDNARSFKYNINKIIGSF